MKITAPFIAASFGALAFHYRPNAFSFLNPMVAQCKGKTMKKINHLKEDIVDVAVDMEVDTLLP